MQRLKSKTSPHHVSQSRSIEVDIDWLNMANDIKFNEKQMWENRTKTYLQETESLEKWNEEINRET